MLNYKQLLKLRPFLVVALLFIAWLIAPIAFKYFSKESMYEFHAPISVAASYTRDLQDYWANRAHSKAELYEIVRDLERLNAGYEIAAGKSKSLQEEIKRLESLLQLPSRPKYSYEIARVVERDFNSWWQQIVIRKGRIHGVEEGAPVVFAGGVVGRVRQANAYTSIVDLLSNNRLRLAVVIEGDNRPISFRGAGSQWEGTPVGMAEYIPTDVTIEDPMNKPRLITSGMGGVFPPGLQVGQLSSLGQGANAMFLEARVQLDSRLRELQEVAVLIKLNDEMP